ncbi:MAG TPA: hypothetical protein VFP63_00085 [Dehalococcoidia bacterium]|nr:hypothetical protein [Dehalococcoidia bacterium]
MVIQTVFRPAWRRLSTLGIAIPLLMGVVLVILVLMSFTRDAYEPPVLVTAGTIGQYEPGEPKLFEDEKIWMVRLPETDQMLALYGADPVSRCLATWDPTWELRGSLGWFRDTCQGSTYDLAGNCFDGPCDRGLSRFKVTLQQADVIVSLTELEPGAPRDDGAEPVVAPRE